MAIVRVQAPTFANNSGTTTTKAFASNVTAGNLLVAWATTDGSATFTFSSPGATWVTVASFLETSSGQHIAIGYAANVPGGATTVTCTYGAFGNFNTLIVAEYSGAATVSPLDANTTGTHLTPSTTPTDSSMTATGADLVVSCLVLAAGGVTTTAGSGFSVIANDTSNLFAAEDQVLTSSGSIAASWNLTGAVISGIMSAAFKPAAGGTTINGTGTATGAGTVTSAASILAPGSSSGLGAVTANSALGSFGAGTGLGVVTPAATLLAPGTATGLGTVTALASLRSTGVPTGLGQVLTVVTLLAPGTATGVGVATGNPGGGSAIMGTGTATGLGSVTAVATQLAPATPTGLGQATGAVTFQPAAATATGLGTATNATVQILSAGSAVGTGTATNGSVRIIAIGHATGAGVATGSRKTSVSGIIWQFDEPAPVWTVSMIDTRRAVISDGYVRFRIARDHQGLPYNPTAAAVSVAYLPAWGNPGPSDWHTAAWSTSYINGYSAYADPGPAGANLLRGTFFVWVKIVDNVLGETVVTQVGRLIVQ